VTWHAAVSANIGNHMPLLDEMRESGCQSLFIGFESVNSESIHSARKFQNKTVTYERLIANLHARGIMVNASLAFGFDHDGPSTFQRTLDWLVRNKVESMTAHILTPYPGTALFKRLTQEGRITDLNWNHYNTSNVVFEPKLMTKDQLYAGYLWMYRHFYSLRSIIARLPEEHRNRVPYLLFNLGYRKFGKFTSRFARLGMMSSVGALARRLSYGIT
jgi:radical SAM superfamily enzyme YgiQ (UPF0313 family)